MKPSRVIQLHEDTIDSVTRLVGPVGLALYLQLCRHIDGNRCLQRAYADIADDLGVSRRTVIRHLNEMEGANMIRRDNYRLYVVGDGGVGLSPDSVIVAPHGDNTAPKSDTVTPKLSNSSSSSTTTKNKTIAHGPTPGFDRFWQAYPRRVGKAEAQKMWAEMGLERDADRIVASVEAHKSAGRFSDDPKYIVYPVRWLQRRRFDDEVATEPTTMNRQEGRFRAG